ncbi:ATP-binding protein [Paraburkholderia bryophila]|uniref:hybrid sensor histidine kinase/response regulator n=1 Tax=Paraburkholderia bryophila TaxID=420952 RepID=UPI00234A0E63|nr:ATP-binding protein [Paraburkholderia bryophila]WCM21981.1 ATP-binding protein [Paraburkholderia bryophila]
MPGINRQPPTIAETFEDAPCGLLLTTVDGTIARANATFCRWTGYDVEELVGKRRLQDLLTVGGRIFHQTHWAPLLAMQRSVAELKLDLVHCDGQIVPALVNASRRSFGDTEYDELAVLVVAERHRYERELLIARREAESALEARLQAQLALEEANRRKDEFLAVLAHELRNPLAPMRNVLELIRRKEFVDPQLVWARAVFERQLLHMTHLVDDLLEVSRITQGKLALRKQPIELGGAMQTICESMRPIVQEAGHELIVSFPKQPVWLDADPTRFAQMIQNLLNNAVKYTPVAGKIWLTGTREDGEAVVSVRDNGIGIEQKQLSAVFEMFAQIDSAHQFSQGGLGIGLSLVRALAELHGGSVVAESAGRGRGSEFLIRLPVSEHSATALPPEQQSSTAAQGDRRRVLIVDDNEDAATSLALLLELEGYTLRVAFNATEALRVAPEFEPQVAILDIGLPDLSGYDLARRIRALPDCPVTHLVALTGWGQEQDKREASRAGFTHHFTKPVDTEELLTVLRAPPTGDDGR